MKDAIITATAKTIANRLKAAIPPATGYDILFDRAKSPEQIFGECVYRAAEDEGIDFAAQVIAFATDYDVAMIGDAIWDKINNKNTIEEAVINVAATAWERDF